VNQTLKRMANILRFFCQYVFINIEIYVK
jgi:hypothetical protein